MKVVAHHFMNEMKEIIAIGIALLYCIFGMFGRLNIDPPCLGV